MFCLIILPEQNEGKESGYVCKVLTDNIGLVKKNILGKGLGVQGYDDGVKVTLCKEFNDWPYVILELTIEQLKCAIRDGEMSWKKVLGWQQFGHSYADGKTKIIVLDQEVRISDYFKKTGYQIIKDV